MNTVSFKNTCSKKKKNNGKKINKNKDVIKQLCILMRMNQPFSSKEASLVPYK